MDSELGIDQDQQMHMIGHNLHFDDLSPSLRSNLPEDGFKTLIHPVD